MCTKTSHKKLLFPNLEREKIAETERKRKKKVNQLKVKLRLAFSHPYHPY